MSVDIVQNLAKSLKAHYTTPLSDSEAKEAAGNLCGFLSLLMEIDKEHGITRPKTGERP